MITTIKLRLSNAYLIQGEQSILIDSGVANEAEAIETAVRQAGVDPHDIKLLLHTHLHSDHVGSSVALKKRFRWPLAYHPADQRLMDLGHNGTLNGLNWRGRLMVPLFRNTPFETFAPDLPLTDGLSLEPFGINGRVLHTPGHTAGSVSVLLDNGEAIVGDVLMGGYLGGALLPQQPNYHYFGEAVEQVHNSLQTIAATGTTTLYVGHGGPVTMAQTRKRFAHLF